MKSLLIGLLATATLFAQAQAATPWWTEQAQVGVPAVFTAADPLGWTKFAQAGWPIDSALVVSDCTVPSYDHDLARRLFESPQG